MHEERVYTLLLPFPQKFDKKKVDEKFSNFLDIFKNLYVNIPFMEAFKQVLLCMKFMKIILSKKRKFEDYETIFLMEGWSNLGR